MSENKETNKLKNHKPNGELIEGHEYDGIQELDHPLPRWWLYLFYGTIIFSIGYVAYYWFLGGPSHQEQLDRAMAKINQNKVEAKAKTEEAVAEVVDIEALLKDKNALALGEQSYQQVCAVCHGAKGEGLIGPNLTDKYWLHSKGDFEGILAAIIHGFPDKGMPPWGDIVPKERHAPLTAYVMSLQGTNPPGAKAAQGDLVP